MRIPVQNPKTKTWLLDAAQELILKKGFSATSVDEICKKAGVSKGTFFHYFKSKELLGKAALENFCCSSRKKMEECCCREHVPADPLERVLNYVDFAISMSKNTKSSRGCLIGAMVQELSDASPGIRAACCDGFNEWAKVIKEDLREAKQKYVPRAAFDAEGLADHFIAIFEGAQILARAKNDKKIIEKNLEHFKQYLKILFKNQQKGRKR